MVTNADGRTKRAAPKGAKTAHAHKATKRAAKTATSAKPGFRSGRIAAPGVRLGMTAPEVRKVSGQPECILFGADDHVEWQFGTQGVDPVGAPTLYVTTLTFAAGRVVRITERMAEVG